MRTTVIAGVFGGLLGLVAAGVWAFDQPADVGQAYVVSDAGGFSSFASPPDPSYTGGGFTDFAPAPGPRLPLSLWLALPAATAGLGAATGAIAAAVGVRVVKERTGTSGL